MNQKTINDPVVMRGDGYLYGQYRGYNYAVDKSTHTFSMLMDGVAYVEFTSIRKLHKYIDNEISSKNKEQAMTETMAEAMTEAFSEKIVYSGIKPVSNHYVSVDEFQSKVIDFLVKQPWFMEMIQTRKSSWIANSRGGEPNCRREEDEPYVVG